LPIEPTMLTVTELGVGAGAGAGVGVGADGALLPPQLQRARALTMAKPAPKRNGDRIA